MNGGIVHQNLVAAWRYIVGLRSPAMVPPPGFGPTGNPRSGVYRIIREFSLKADTGSAQTAVSPLSRLRVSQVTGAVIKRQRGLRRGAWRAGAGSVFQR